MLAPYIFQISFAYKQATLKFVEEVNTSHPSVVTANSHPKQLLKDTKTAEAANNNQRCPTIVRESRKDQEPVLKDSEKLGLYSIDMSVRQHDFLRLKWRAPTKKTQLMV